MVLTAGCHKNACMNDELTAAFGVISHPRIYTYYKVPYMYSLHVTQFLTSTHYISSPFLYYTPYMSSMN